ncbi:unnamed protein product [Owenia fusiformis]|uniref:Metalloendopeptidase n=1 Tax=Owenia fusiformis TaxID=6347 RepID=A0A8S4P0M5_OWEFU|nr:unnamed protein product [Owenia fusiformis]
MAERGSLGWFHLGLIASVLVCAQIEKATSNDVNEPTDENKIYIKQDKRYKCVLTTCMEIPIGGEESGIIGNPEENNNDTSLYEGDIVSPPVLKGVAESRYRNALNMKSPDMSAWYELWYFKANREPRGKVFYEFDSSLSSRQKNDILSAMEEIQIKSGGATSKCIQFIPNNGNLRDHLLIKSTSSSCQSSGIGKDKEERQPYINLGPGCFVIGTIMHELLHAVGFFHEHVRNDRDDYIEIITSNIKSGYISQFAQPEFSNDLISYTPYDYDSVMHYGKYTFSKDAGRGLQTIRIKSGRSTNLEIGQRDHLSKSDIKDLQVMYSCPDIGVAAGEEAATPPNYVCTFEADDLKCGFVNGHSSIWKSTPVSRIGAKYYDATFSFPSQNIGNVLYMAPGRATTDALFTANVPPAEYCLQINYFCHGTNSKAQVYSGMKGTKKLLYTLPTCKDFTWYYTWMGIDMSTSGTIEIHGLRANIGHFLLDDIKLMEKPTDWKDCNQ